MTWIESFGVLTGLISVWLTVRNNVWCWFWGIVSVTLYVGVFFRERLYADMSLQIVFIATNLYGWYVWLRGGEHHTKRVITKIPLPTAVTLAIGTLCYAVMTGWLLKRTTDASLPEMDAFLTSMSLAAVWMQARKYREHWLVWFAADVLYVGMFVWKSLWMTAVLYAVFTVLAVIGFVEWNKEVLRSESFRVQSS